MDDTINVRKEQLAGFIDSFEYTFVITLFILFSVFAWDISDAWLPKAMDPWIELGMTITFGVFIAELILMIYAVKGWWKSINFWLCVVATAAMVLEIPWLTRRIAGASIITGSGIMNLRLHKLFRMFARVGRLLRIFKTLLLNRFKIVLSRFSGKRSKYEYILNARLAQRRILRTMRGNLWGKLENTTSLSVMGVFAVIYIISVMFISSIERPSVEADFFYSLQGMGSPDTGELSAVIEKRYPTILYAVWNGTTLSDNREAVSRLRKTEVEKTVFPAGELWVDISGFTRTRANRYIALTFLLIVSISIIVTFINWAITRFAIDLSGALKTLAQGLDERDPYTHRHSQHVSLYARKTAEELGMSKEEQKITAIAGELHDIGKIGLSETILLKKGKLTDMEYVRMKTHPERAAVILDPLTDFDPVILSVRHHHERFDGTGYPDGLEGDAIPRIAKILAVCDVWDAITTDRPYRPSMSHQEAKQVILDGIGNEFDPAVVKAFFTAVDNLEKADSPGS